MSNTWPRARGTPCASALIRCRPEDFEVSEELGFELSGEGEHVFLYLQKRNLNSMELLQRLAALSGVPERDIGVSGLKDRNAVTRQWFSVGMAGRQEPDWLALEAGADVQLLQRGRHSRKLRRGVPAELDVVLDKALDPDPERRYASIAEFAEDLLPEFVR